MSSCGSSAKASVPSVAQPVCESSGDGVGPLVLDWMLRLKLEPLAAAQAYLAPSVARFVSPATVATHHTLPAWSEVNWKLHCVPVQPLTIELIVGAVCSWRRALDASLAATTAVELLTPPLTAAVLVLEFR